MKCNACWQTLNGRAVATICGHVFCIEDGTKILRSESTCPMCDRVLSKSDMKAVEISPKDEWVNMAMAGIPPDSIMKSAFKGVVFWMGQMDVEAQLTVSKALQLREKFEEMQTKYMEKLKQVHDGYQKAVKKIQLLTEERDSILKDKTELQEKYAEKSRQKRKLEEMYEVLRAEYEKSKRSSQPNTTLQPLGRGLANANQFDFTAPTPSAFYDPNLQVRADSKSMAALDTVLAPITPAAYCPSQLWPARQRPGSSLFEIPGRPPTRSTRNMMIGGRPQRIDSKSSPFDTSDPSLFTIDKNITSDGVRNLLLSPLNISGPTSRLPPSGFR